MRSEVCIYYLGRSKFVLFLFKFVCVCGIVRRVGFPHFVGYLFYLGLTAFADVGVKLKDEALAKSNGFQDVGLHPKMLGRAP